MHHPEWATVHSVVMGVEAQLDAGATARLDQRWSLFALLVVLNVFDVITTELVIQNGGHETNPLIQPIVGSVLAVSALKAVVLAIVGILLSRCTPSRSIAVALTLTTGWYIAVVTWNTVVLVLL